MNIPATQLSINVTAGIQPKAQFTGAGQGDFAAALEGSGALMAPAKPMRGIVYAGMEVTAPAAQDDRPEETVMAAAMVVPFPFQAAMLARTLPREEAAMQTAAPLADEALPLIDAGAETGPLLQRKARGPQSVQVEPDAVWPQARELSDAAWKKPLVSILEGDQNDDNRTSPSPARGPALETAARQGGEDMARMPQLIESTEGTAQKAEVAPSAQPLTGSPSSGDSCPLENENKSQQEKPQNSPAREFPVQQMVDIAPERVLAAAPQEAGDLARPVSADRLLDAMVERMTLTEAADGKQLELQLRPEHLGKVEIQLSLGDDGLKAKIRVGNDQVKELINSQISQLIESIAEKGVKISQMDVVYTGIQDQGFSRQSQQGQQETRHSRARGLRADGADEFAPALLTPVWGENLSDGTQGEDNSVEYRA